MPWNGVRGDVNQDGIFYGDGSGSPEVDDFAAFMAGWDEKILPGVFGTRESYMKGVLNLDGRVDMHDAHLMRTYLINNSFPPGRLVDLDRLVPEPRGFTLLALALSLLAVMIQRGKQRQIS